MSSGRQFATPSSTDTLVQDGKHKVYTVSSSQNDSSMSGHELNLGLQESDSIVELVDKNYFVHYGEIYIFPLKICFDLVN